MQAWLTVAGLVLDFAGFMLLLREWYLAFFAEQRELDRAKARERDARLRHHMSQSIGSESAGEAARQHMATANRMRDEMAAARARTEVSATLAARRRMFVAAAVLITLGFILQVAGAFPLP
jgi:UPF0716 family protein affecting phage T7 exclusion